MILYYQFDYKRHYISDNKSKKIITIWQRFGNKCYIIPGKYASPILPNKNYIKTVNYRNYIGVLFETNDFYSYKISLYNRYEKISLDSNIKIYNSNDSLLLEYGILDEFDLMKGKRLKNKYATVLKSHYDYKYIDLNKPFGIKIYDY